MNELPRIWGHRGASAAAPENTIAAFSLVRDYGGDGVELDVRRTLDGELVVFHDAECGFGGTTHVIAQSVAASLDPEIPTLTAALDVCRGMTVNVELKNSPSDAGYDPESSLAADVAALLQSRDDDTIVSSFDQRTLAQFRAAAPEIRTGLLHLFKPPALEAIEVAVAAGHVAVHPHVGFATAEVIEAAHAAGLAVHVWTVDDPAAMVQLAADGADAIITNVVDVAVATLR